MTLDEQMAELTRNGSERIIYLARPGVFALAAGLVLTGIFTGNPVFYGIALVVTLIGLAIWRVTPHIDNAVRGLREGLMQKGEVEITIDHWTDAESNHYEFYKGLISIDSQPLWFMEFVTPRNWQPKEGKYSGQLAFIPGVEWPVVMITADGLLYPRLKPRRATVVS
ncbi:MAG: hypothetical protein K4571_10865 [Deltaproteobacteria bacterium]